MTKKVLLIASYAPSLIKFRLELIESFLHRGCSVSVAAPHISEFPLVCDQLNSMGVSVYDLSFRRSGQSPIGDVSAFLSMIRVMYSVRPEVVLAYTIKPVIYGMLAAFIMKVPIRVALITGLGYVFIGGGDKRRIWLRKLVSKLYKLALSRTSLVFFQNPDDLAYFRSLGIVPAGLPTALVNGSGVDIESFAVADFPPVDKVTFLMIARLLGNKGVREYASAALLVIKRYPNVEFHLVGGLDPSPNGLSLREVVEWVDGGIIHWHNELADVGPSIASSHVYVLPSYSEGTPRTVLEAMSMGRPIITTDAPGCRETVIEGENGFLVPVGSVELLAGAMERFIKEPHLISVMGRRSREIAEDKFDVHKVNEVMLRGIGVL